MPWCPNCGVEYRQGYKTCIDCKLDLVSEPRPMEETNDDDAGEAHLLSLTDPLMADMIEALLISNKIPVLKMFRQAGGYLNLYMGTTAFGVDLYVPAKLLEEAREIVENNHQPVTESDQEIDEEYQYDNNKRKDRVWVIILFFIPGVFWLGIIVLFFIYFGMRQ
ncbi:MAG: DUF2007 domain-containing protein [Sporomusaceae bacterium]|nr:DUF2007 domain-containing protein [Sporomusaceae bacterium]